MGSPTAKLDSQRGDIFATLQVVGESVVPETATIRSSTQTGNIVIELVSKTPARTINIDAYSQTGNISLLIPRNFSGIVEFRGRRSDIELLPALAAYAIVERTNNNETVVVIGNNAPTPGYAGVGDFARIYSCSGRMRLGFCGEDSFLERGGIVGHIFRRFGA